MDATARRVTGEEYLQQQQQQLRNRCTCTQRECDDEGAGVQKLLEGMKKRKEGNTWKESDMEKRNVCDAWKKTTKKKKVGRQAGVEANE